jgi:carboxylesterase type B
VQKYISGFGGNPGDVTAFGESAGSMSLAYHISSTVPLFQRAVLQSGTASSAECASLAQRDEQYLRLLEFCGIDKQDLERLEKLRKVPIEKLIAGVQGIGVFSTNPTVDEGFFPVTPTWGNEAQLWEKCEWVKEIVIGESLYEVRMRFV